MLDFETVKVRFFPPVMAFIEESKASSGKKNQSLQRQHYRQPKYLDYTVKLPPRSP